MKRETYNNTIVKEFSRFAHSYTSHNMIQKEVAKELVSTLPRNKYKHILDVGCGSGAIYQYMIYYNHLFKTYIALDSSENMLKRHPCDTKIKKYCINFDNENAFNTIQTSLNHLIISSSALQWSRDLDKLFKKLSELSTEIHLAIFTSNTFKTLHQTAHITSPIQKENIIKDIVLKYYPATFKLKQYKLYFNSTAEMLKYIKRSGVSGGEKKLSFKETKALIDNYPLDYLEFEVLFVSTVV